MSKTTPFIQANILEVKKFVLKMQPNTQHHRLVKDYEFDYQLNGSRKITINGKNYTISSGSMICRHPGDYVTSSGDYNTYTLTLDFSKRILEKDFIYYRDSKNLTMQPKYNNPLLDMIPVHFTPDHSSDYIRIFDRLCILSNQNVKNSEKDILLNEFFGLMLVDTLKNNENHEIYKNQIVIDACNYIAENYDKDLTLQLLAKKFSISQSHFLRIFKHETNSTPMAYIIQIRLNNAQRLLRETNLNVNNIAIQCGFNDASYFSHLFKKRFDISPLAYRNSKES